MADPADGKLTAYFCECSKRWVFQKAEVGSAFVVLRVCDCGRAIIADRGILYGAEIRRVRRFLPNLASEK